MRLGGAPVTVHTARRRWAAWPLAADEDGGQLLGKMEYHCMVLRQESGMLTFVRSTDPQCVSALLGSGVLMPIIRSPDPS
ncbi:hypothetical protein ACLOJK_029370, partial [Asimina triloba]